MWQVRHRFGDDWHGPYMGFEHLELMQLGHNYWLPERPPGGMHYERWYHGDGLRDPKYAPHRQQLGSPSQLRKPTPRRCPRMAQQQLGRGPYGRVPARPGARTP